MSKKVLCSKCGFLCLHISDVRDPDGMLKRWGIVGQTGRNALVAGALTGTFENPEYYEYYRLSCFKGQWIWAPERIHIGPDYVDVDRLKKLAKCRFYVDFDPGTSPENHNELKRDRENRRTVRNATIIGVAFGAAAAILAQVIFAVVEAIVSK